MKGPIEVVDYDPAWRVTFEMLRDRIRPAVQGLAAGIEHVGSTSVEGLAAKPVVDMNVVVPDGRVPEGIAALEGLGYVHRGDLGVPKREAFRAPPGTPRHHLYLSPESSTALANHRAVRDWLRAHPDAAVEYGALKRELARRHPYDIDRYVDGKTDFLVGILRRAGLTEEQLDTIRGVNEVPGDAGPS